MTEFVNDHQTKTYHNYFDEHDWWLTVCWANSGSFHLSHRVGCLTFNGNYSNGCWSNFLIIFCHLVNVERFIKNLCGTISQMRSNTLRISECHLLQTSHPITTNVRYYYYFFALICIIHHYLEKYSIIPKDLLLASTQLAVFFLNVFFFLICVREHFRRD